MNIKDNTSIRITNEFLSIQTIIINDFQFVIHIDFRFLADFWSEFISLTYGTPADIYRMHTSPPLKQYGEALIWIVPGMKIQQKSTERYRKLEILIMT